MRVNSEETLRRAAAFKREHAGKSWLELSRQPRNRELGLRLFAGADRPTVNGTEVE